MHANVKTIVVHLSASIALGSAVLCGQSAPASAAGVHEPKAILVELFTSEGCSSCPPADTLLRQVSGTRSESGPLIIGISEHVTYWNSLGWKDPFSADVYTARQTAYSTRFNLDGIYTPQMVVNGAEELNGSDRGALMRAVQHQSQQLGPITLRILSTHANGSTLSADFIADGALPAGGADIIAVLADDADSSSVLRGENSGHTLAHVAVARSLQRVSTLSAGNHQTVQLVIPASFQGAQGHHLILFVQAPGYGRVLGVDTAPI